MKKIIAIMLVTIMAMTIIACDPKPTKPTQTSESVTVTESDTYPVSDIATDDVSSTPVDSEIESEVADTEVSTEVPNESETFDESDWDVDERGW